MTLDQNQYPRALHKSMFDELKFQIRSRHAMAVSRLEEYDGDDPITALTLTDFQRGSMLGKIETLDFMKRMVHELEEIYAKKQEENREDISTED